MEPKLKVSAILQHKEKTSGIFIATDFMLIIESRMPMDQEQAFISLNTDNCPRPQAGETLLESQAAFAQVRGQADAAEVTIVIVACNRLPKTQRCVQSLLEYTKEIDYDLILIDSGSGDGTLEYFNIVPYERKKIIHISKNLGGMFPFLSLNLMDVGDYLVFLVTYIVVTPHWLENLLLCAKSDPKIGMVAPMASNCSNLQGMTFPFSSYEDMEEKAGNFNKSDPGKWQERIRLITLAPLFKKEALMAIGFPLFAPAFYHDFGDDDIAFRVRRMGYKIMVAGDTWIHHDHDYSAGEDKNPEEFARSLQMGKKDFREKYFGVDAWDDVNNFYRDILPYIPAPSTPEDTKILGIDVKCGTPILEIKNRLREYGVFKADTYAFTQQDKYTIDLRTVCNGPVCCDREEFLPDYYTADFFDYIIIDQPVNAYRQPKKIIRDSFGMLKKGGILILSLINPLGVSEYLNILGQRDTYGSQYLYNITPEILLIELKRYGDALFCITRERQSSGDERLKIRNLIKDSVPDSKIDVCMDRLYAEKFIFGMVKYK